MSEHAEQVALIQWCLTEARHTPDLGLIYAVPNAGKREGKQGAWMVAEGLRRGMLDLCLPVPSLPNRDGEYTHSFYLELKFGDNKPDPDQEWWISRLEARGHLVGVFWDWQLAAMALEDYVQVPQRYRTQWLTGPAQERAQRKQENWLQGYLQRKEKILDAR